jgi:hypothetical protein
MEIAAAYHRVIDAIVASSGLPDSMLHMHAGMILMLGTAIVSRRSLSSPIPLVVVAVMEGGNEVMDRLSFGSWRMMDTSLDLFNTLIWPASIFLLSRWRRFEAKRKWVDARTLAAAQLAKRRAALREDLRTHHHEPRRKAA